MHTHDDIVDLTPAQRFREIASILATGILRLRRHSVTPISDEENCPEPAENCLELADDSWLSVPRG